MNHTEKEDLPVHLKNRDRGGMYFPKKHFLASIRQVLDKVRRESVGANFEAYGTNIAKVRWSIK